MHKERLQEIKRKKDEENKAKIRALQMFEEDREEQRRKREMKKFARPQIVEKKRSPKIKSSETKLMVSFHLTD